MPCLLYIRSVVGRILMSRIVRKLHKGKTAAVVHLRGEHETNLFSRHLGRQMNHTLNILHGVTVSISVAKPTVDKGCRARPDKGHKAVVGIPCIDHGIEGRVWCLYLKVG